VIRAVIVAVVLALAAVLFLPQTVAAFPSLEGVMGALASDVAGVRDGALSWVTEMLTGALARAGGAIADALPGALGGTAG